MDSDKKDEIMQNEGTLRSITVNLSGIDKKQINRVAKEFYTFVKDIDASAQEPTILAVEEACFTTRKSPCGNGTATFSRVKLRVHQRKFDISVYDQGFTRVVDFLKVLPVEAQLKMNF